MYERSHSGYYNIWLLQFIVTVFTHVRKCNLQMCYNYHGHFAGPEGQLQDLHDFLVWFMLLRGQCFGVVDALAHSMF